MLPGFCQAPNSVRSQFDNINTIEGSGAAHFVAHRQHGLAIGTVFCGDERQALGPKVTSNTRLQIFLGDREIPVIQLLHELRILGIGDIVDHDSANTLQTDKCKGLAVDRSNCHRFGLRTLIIRPVIEGILVIVAVEVVGDQAGSDTLKFAATVEHSLAVSSDQMEKDRAP